ncbi:MAG: hypothetical protein ACKVOB_11800 [Sphingomonas sp.]
MIGNSKPLASLSSGLLARKGQARPAMRPQGFAGFNATPQNLEDLGWNDMGDAPSELPFTEAAGAVGPAVAFDTGYEPVRACTDAIPPVLHQRAALADELEATPAANPAPQEPEQAPMPVAKLRPSNPRQTVAARAMGGAKAAFTLRLDAERHLRLRLASAVQNRSSQQLVTQALDSLLATLPEVEEMARRQSAGGTHDLDKGN